jgi:hypothetical protein
LDLIVVEVLTTMLKICGIATKYAKTNSFKRSLSPIANELT